MDEHTRCPFCGTKSCIVLYMDYEEDDATREIDNARYCMFCEYLFTVNVVS